MKDIHLQIQILSKEGSKKIDIMFINQIDNSEIQEQQIKTIKDGTV